MDSSVAKWRVAICLLSAALYSASVSLPCFSTNGGSPADGLAVLLVGWAGLFVDPLSYLSWLANPLYLLSLLLTLFRKNFNDGLLLLSLAAFILAISFLGVKDIITDAGGLARPITHYHMGYWLWISCMVVLFGVQFFLVQMNKRNP